MNAERHGTDHRNRPGADLCPSAAIGADAGLSRPPLVHLQPRFTASAAHARLRSWNLSHTMIKAEGPEQ